MAVSWGFVAWCLVAGAAEPHLTGAGSLAARCVSGCLRVQRRRAPWFWEITR